MSNTRLAYCPTCRKLQPFYQFEFETWECEECGREVDDADIVSPLMGDDDDWEDE